MDSTVINIDPQVENQPSNQQTIQTYDSLPDSIDQHTNDQQEHLRISSALQPATANGNKPQTKYLTILL